MTLCAVGAGIILMSCMGGAEIYDTPEWQNKVPSKNEGTEIKLEEYQSLVGKIL